jgi:hypothetical protein
MRVKVTYFADTVAAMSTGWLRRAGITKNFQATTTAMTKLTSQAEAVCGLGLGFD